MPKFKRVCKNPLHETWSKNNESKVINVQAHGFLTVASALQQYVEAELGKKIRHKKKPSLLNMSKKMFYESKNY